MGKKVTNNGIGKYGIAIDLGDTISNNWFLDKATRDENFKRLKSSGSKDISKIKR